MDFSKQVNYKSDFDVLLHLTDAEGNAVGFPDFDFLLTFFTSGQKKFEAGQVDGTKRGVSDAEGDVRVVFNNHGLPAGVLNLEIRADVRNSLYPDGKKLQVFTVPTNITLTAENGETSTGLKIDVTLPFTIEAEPEDNTDESGTTSDEADPVEGG